MTKDKQELIAIAERIVIAHRTDGPVNRFVAIMRAMRAAADGGDPEILGEALNNVLEDLGNHEIPSNEEEHYFQDIL